MIKESADRHAEKHTSPPESDVSPVDRHATPMDANAPTTERHSQPEDTTLVDCNAIQKLVPDPQGGAIFGIIT